MSHADAEADLVTHPVFGDANAIWRARLSYLNAAGVPFGRSRSIPRSRSEFAFRKAHLAGGVVNLPPQRFSDSAPEWEPSRDVQYPEIWTLTDDPTLSEALAHLVATESRGPSAQVVGEFPSDLSVRVARAAQFLAEYLPLATQHILPFCDYVVPVTGGDAFNGASMTTLPGFVLIHLNACKDDPSLASTLLHESLHSKIESIGYQGSLMSEHYSDTTSSAVLPPWHRPPAYAWNADRVLAAFHVYSHVQLLFRELRVQSRPGVDVVAARRSEQRSLFRAHYLSGVLRNRAEADLSENGVALVKWLTAQLPELVGLSPAGERALASASA